jgi:hypothetical protein
MKKTSENNLSSDIVDIVAETTGDVDGMRDTFRVGVSMEELVVSSGAVWSMKGIRISSNTEDVVSGSRIAGAVRQNKRI